MAGIVLTHYEVAYTFYDLENRDEHSGAPRASTRSSGCRSYGTAIFTLYETGAIVGYVDEVFRV